MQNTLSFQVGGSVLALPPQAVREILAFVDYIQFKYQQTKAPQHQDMPKKESDTSPFDRLYGVISLPEDFDFKEFMSEELLADYLKL